MPNKDGTGPFSGQDWQCRDENRQSVNPQNVNNDANYNFGNGFGGGFGNRGFGNRSGFRNRDGFGDGFGNRGGFGGGFGNRGGFGGCFGRRIYCRRGNFITSKQTLREQKLALQERLDTINKQLKED